MDPETLSLLEFPKVVQLVEKFAQSDVGRVEVSRLAPSRDRREIEQNLTQVEEMIRCFREQGRVALDALEDPRPVLEALRPEGASLETEDFLLLLNLFALGTRLKAEFSKEQWPLLAAQLEAVPDLGPLVHAIDRVLDPGGTVRDKADPELAAVRRKQSRARKKTQDHLSGYFSGPRAKFLISDPYITVRNARYVIPVKMEHQRDLQGVVHATSSSGATVFIEPLAAVPLNNDCLHCQQREQEIVGRILRELTGLLRTHLTKVETLVKALARIDALCARAEFAIRYDCVIPKLNEENVLHLRQARHPLLLERMGVEEVVPISVELSAKQNALVISGPNAGGKTVALKTVGLLSVMAQSGLPVPAAAAECPVFAQISADIGDHQSISEQLSTFSAHILRMKAMIAAHEKTSLVLLDELGTGTDPVYGSALGVAVIDFFLTRGAMIVATTHHQTVKAFASATPGVENASVGLDPETLHPTYQLDFGMAGDSSALEIAAQLGLPKGITKRARTMLTETDLQAERYLQRLRDELSRLTEERQRFREETRKVEAKQNRLQAQFEASESELRRSLEKRIDEWREDFKAEGRRFIKSIKDRFEAARMRKEMKRKEALLKEKFQRRMSRDRSTEGKTADVAAGDRVYHAFFKKQGQIIDLKNGEAIVEIGGKKISTSVDQLAKVEDQKPPRRLPPNVRVNAVEEQNRELNLLGFTVEEALPKLDKFLDRAFLGNLTEVRIIHGLGTGKLKRAVSEFLADHPHVEKHRIEGGATVATLRV